MNTKKTEPRSNTSSKHPSLGCINFYSYPSEYTFTTPQPLKIVQRPHLVKPLKRRNRSRRASYYSKHNIPDWSQPYSFFPMEFQHGNNDRVDTGRRMESDGSIINLNSVTDYEIDNMSFAEYADYVSQVLSLGEEIAFKNLPPSSYKMLKNRCFESSFEVQNLRCPSSQIYFQGVPLATKDFSHALRRLTNTWLMLKPYMEFQQNVYDTRISPQFQNYFMEWQTTNKRLMFHLLKTIFKLGRVTANITPYSEIFNTAPNTLTEFSDDIKEFQSNSQMKIDSYFDFNQDEDLLAAEHLDQEEEEEAHAFFALTEHETQHHTRSADNQQKNEGFVDFPQSELEYSEAGYYFDLYENEAHDLTFADYQQETETLFSFFSDSKFENVEEEQENPIFTFSQKESTDIRKWSVELLAKSKESSSSAFPENDCFDPPTENANDLPKTNNELKKNPYVVAPETDFNIKMKNYKYAVEFTHKAKNVHSNVKKLLKEDKITKINVLPTFQMETVGKQENTRLNSFSFSDHETL